MAYEVRLAHRAIQDLSAIYEAKSAETSPPAAAWYLGLRDAILSLETMPLRGSVAHDAPQLRHLLYGHKPHVYRILYTIDEAARIINVVQVRHGARDVFTRVNDP